MLFRNTQYENKYVILSDPAIHGGYVPGKGCECQMLCIVSMGKKGDRFLAVHDLRKKYPKWQILRIGGHCFNGKRQCK